MAVNNEEFVVWQWNCASYKQRKAPLQQFIAAQEVKPHVILLQETLCDTLALPGYRTVTARAQGHRGLATLVARHCSFQEHKLKLGGSHIETLMIEIIPNGRIKDRLFILNIYSSPSHYHQSFTSVVAKAAALARNFPIIIAGDFNASHAAWGYPRHMSSRKGTNLLQAITDCSFRLITDPQYPTRLGTSVARDTTPDLAFVKNITGAAWHNLQENLGSDHFITTISVKIDITPMREFKVTDWDAFRKLCKDDDTEYEKIDDLLARLKTDVQKVTRVIKTDQRVDRMDARLAHLLQAKRSILTRRAQRLN